MIYNPALLNCHRVQGRLLRYADDHPENVDARIILTKSCQILLAAEGIKAIESDALGTISGIISEGRSGITHESSFAFWSNDVLNMVEAVSSLMASLSSAQEALARFTADQLRIKLTKKGFPGILSYKPEGERGAKVKSLCLKYWKSTGDIAHLYRNADIHSSVHWSHCQYIPGQKPNLKLIVHSSKGQEDLLALIRDAVPEFMVLCDKVLEVMDIAPNIDLCFPPFQAMMNLELPPDKVSLLAVFSEDPAGFLLIQPGRKASEIRLRLFAPNVVEDQFVPITPPIQPNEEQTKASAKEPRPSSGIQQSTLGAQPKRASRRRPRRDTQP